MKTMREIDRLVKCRKWRGLESRKYEGQLFERMDNGKVIGPNDIAVDVSRRGQWTFLDSLQA